MTQLELIKGAALVLAANMLEPTNAKIGSITVGLNPKDKGAEKYYRVTVKELTKDEVEHYQEEVNASSIHQRPPRLRAQ